MLKKLLKTAVFCAPFAMIACSDDASTAPSIQSSSSTGTVIQDTTYNHSVIIKDGDTIIQIDTIVTLDTVWMNTTDDVPYYSENNDFFWDAELIPFSSSSSAIKSSSSSATQPQQPSEPSPTINGNVMTDNRNGKQYKLTMVGSAIWMAENISFKIDGSSFCYDDDCEKGILYNYQALATVCPNGWHLPSRSEMESAKALGVDGFPWTYEGRKSGSSYSYHGQMGFWWLSRSSKIQDGDKDNCNSSSCGMIYVQKSEDYGDGEGLFQEDEQTKGFSVRCVQD